MKKKELLSELLLKLEKMHELMHFANIERPYVSDDSEDLPVGVIKKGHEFIDHIYNNAWADIKRLWHSVPDSKYWTRLGDMQLSHSHEGVQMTKAKKALRASFNNPPAFFKIKEVNKLLSEKVHKS